MGCKDGEALDRGNGRRIVPDEVLRDIEKLCRRSVGSGGERESGSIASVILCS